LWTISSWSHTAFNHKIVPFPSFSILIHNFKGLEKKMGRRKEQENLRSILFQLVNRQGQNFKGLHFGALDMAPSATIADCRKRVVTLYPRKRLDYAKPEDLVFWEVFDCLEMKEHEPVRADVGHKYNPLIIEVRAVSLYFCWFLFSII
jgi:hypothetical protein